MMKMLVSLGMSLCLLGTLACTTTKPIVYETPKKQDPHRFDKAMADFAAADAAKAPPHGAIVFVGSSSIRMWKTLQHDLMPMPVVNRGFGGSTTEEVLFWTPKLVLPLRPRIIVYYAGDNDLITSASNPAIPVENFKKFVELVRKSKSKAQIYFLSIKPSPRRAKAWEPVQEANRRVKRWCKWESGVDFIDITPTLIDAQGNYRLDRFSNDKLHMNAAGYEAWTKIIKPILVQNWTDQTMVMDLGAF
jgi:lysophospholipase L1-like esterase